MLQQRHHADWLVTNSAELLSSHPAFDATAMCLDQLTNALKQFPIATDEYMNSH